MSLECEASMMWGHFASVHTSVASFKHERLLNSLQAGVSLCL